MLFAHEEVTFISLCSIIPGLFPFTMLLIINPLTFVPSSINILVNSFSMTLVILKLSHIKLPIRVDLSPLSICFIFSKLTLKLSSVRPKHDSYTI